MKKIIAILCLMSTSLTALGKDLSRFPVKTAYLLLFATLAMTSSLYAAAPSCADVIGSNLPPPQGLFELKVAAQETRIKNLTASADLLLESLGKDPRWPHINSELVKNIETWVKDYNHTNFSVYTSEMREAIGKIQKALTSSNEFGQLASGQIEEISQALTGRGYFRIPMFSTQQALYHLWIQLGLQNSKELEGVLMQLQGLSEYVSKSHDLKYKAERILASGLKNIKNESELIDRLDKAQKEYANKNSFPQDLIESLVSIAKKYQASKMGNFDVLTEGHHEAMKQYAELTKTHPFFKDVSPQDLERAQWVWNQAVTPNLAQQVLEMIKPNVGSEKAKAEVADIQEALRYLGYK